MAATKKPNQDTLRAAAEAMDSAYSAFIAAQQTFARIVYDAGNKDKDSFRRAMKEATEGWRASGGWIGFSIDTVTRFFKEFDKSTQS